MMRLKSRWSITLNKMLWQHYPKSIGLIGAIVIMSIISSAVQADIIKRIVSAVVAMDKHSLLQVLLLLISVTIVSTLLKVIIARWMFFFKKNLRIVLEDQGIEVLQDLETASIKHDEIMSLIQNSVERVVTSFFKVAHDGIEAVTQIIAAVLYTVSISWEMVLLCWAICAVMLILSNKNNSQIPIKMKKVGESFNNVYSIIWDHLHNAEVSSFLNKERVFAQLESKIVENSNYQIDASKVQNASRIFARFANILVVMVAAVYGGFMAFIFGMDVSRILALIIILQVLADAIFKIPGLFNDFKGLQGEGQVLEKLYNVISPVPRPQYSVEQLLHSPGVIKFQSIQYKYSKDLPPISIVDSLTVKKGEMVCIAGASGAGKTTLLNICAGLVSDYEGAAFWEETDIATIQRKALWSQIHLLEQTPRCLPTTIKNNIILRDQNYDPERLQRALLDSGFAKYVENMPQGIETEIRRNQLSSGELQKLCLARAFYHQRPILLMDEPTSALDPGTEANVITALKRRIRDEGLIVVAVTHRENLLIQSDCVLYMRKNQPSMVGRHEELLAKCESYREMIYSAKDVRNG